MKLVLFVIACLGVSVSAYYPVIMLHGFGANASVLLPLKNTIEKYHRGQKAFSLAVREGNASMVSLWDQIGDVHKGIEDTIAKNPKLFKNGYHLIGHSQGTLLFRAVLEMWPLNVINFVSLAGAQGGLYHCDSPALCEAETLALYSKGAQKSFAAANYWKTPQDQHERYLQHNIFLPYIDNELNYNASYKQNFLRIKQMHMFGSPGDDVIHPWDASLFNYLQTFNVSLPMEKQDIYVKDTFGLRTLNEQGRLFRTAVDGVEHRGWVEREDLQKKYLLDILP